MRGRGTYEGTPRALAKASPSTRRIWREGKTRAGCERERQITAAVKANRGLVRA